MPFVFDNRMVALGERFGARVQPTPVAQPSLIWWNKTLAAELSLDDAEVSALIPSLAGNTPLQGADPFALAYAGHQFGSFVPRLGDGRAILLGEVIDRHGARRDLQLKGSGRTPFSRGGDGRAAVGPVLRELLLSEAMFALGVRTTRVLCAIRTGETVRRERTLPGAILTRVAASHLRVGTFEYFAARDDVDAIATLVNVALARHFADRTGADEPALALLDAVVDTQAHLVAHWLSLGFVHGVMNTDNCAISGETLDYGPCAFLDAYDPARTFSSIDQFGRYAYGNQPRVALWNLARLGETLIPVLARTRPEADAVAIVEQRVARFIPMFQQAQRLFHAAKLGVPSDNPPADDDALAEELYDLMANRRADHTRVWRSLADVLEGGNQLALELGDDERVTAFAARYRARAGNDAVAVAARVRATNPAVIARNHRVEHALAAAEGGDLGPFERLWHALQTPFVVAPENVDLTEAPGPEQWDHRTFCGT